MRGAGIVVLVLTGCQSILGIDEFETAGPTDAAGDAIDSPIDSIDGQLAIGCYSSLATICFTPPPTGALTISGTIDTDADSRCQTVTQSGGPPLCVIAANTITIGAGTTTVRGTRPLVLVGAQTVTIGGTLNASSARAGTPGAAANLSSCAGAIGATGGAGGGGGGAGGTLGQRGGNGGVAGNGALGATASPIASISAIRGGCAGGRGGDGDSPGSGALGSNSGGAVALLAGALIKVELAGGVYASGAGGVGAVDSGLGKRGGGGGAGSGGLIVLEAPMIDVSGTIAANGGGGGGGTRDGNANPGEDGTTTSFMLVASGGVGDGQGGPGGDGGAVASAPKNGVAGINSGGGGGGGGGAGVIWVKGALTGTRLSPAPSLQ